MPKVKYGVSTQQRALEEELRERYGGTLTVVDVCAELGFKDRRSAEKWLAGMPYLRLNNRLRWRAADVAARLFQCTEAAI